MGMKQGNNAFLSTNQLPNQYWLGSYHVPSMYEALPVDGNN